MIEIGPLASLLTELLKFAQKLRPSPASPTPPPSGQESGVVNATRMARIHQLMTEYRLVELEGKASTNLGMSLATFGFLLMVAIELDDESDEDSKEYKEFEEAAELFFTAGVTSVKNGMEWYANEKEQLDQRIKDLCG